MSDFEHRGNERHPISLRGKCRTGRGLRDDVWISDISESGCCISTNGLHLSSGSPLVVRPDGLEGMISEVRWTEGLKAGVQFAEPLYTPVVEHLASCWKAKSA